MNTKPIRPLEILIVDDNPGDVRLAIEGFRQWKLPHEINVVGDGEAALGYLYQEKGAINSPRPDLIFLDVNMPKKSGLEVLSQIKSDELLKTIPVIMLTTSSSDNDIAKAYQSYANCYMVKPSDINELFARFATMEHYWCEMVTLPRE